MKRRVVVAGSSGLIGRALVRSLEERGDDVVTLVRRPARASSEAEWNPLEGSLDPRHIESADAVILLNGASVGRMPWTKGYREKLLASRLQSTNTMVEAIATLGVDAPMLVSGSAVGYYGSAPGCEVSESAPPGDTFLADLCVQWEASALRAESVTRVALLRTAPVIHRSGVLGPLIALTSFGLGGPLGPGTQVWPWVSLEDEVRAILHIIDSQISGPVNVCGPTPATANDIGRAIAHELKRPFWLPAPAWGLKIALGKAATESLLTADANVQPQVLTRTGFTFTHQSVESAVHAAIIKDR